VLALRPGTSPARRAEVLESWYRRQLRTAAEPLATQWQDRLGVRAKAIFVQRMKIRWGSCNTKTSTLRLNTDLAKKPPGCLEYILVHELIHLLEPTHNARFVGLMDRWLPGWEQRRELLNRLPVRHVEWGY
jgi:predicted metal-dependent hydrolase